VVTRVKSSSELLDVPAMVEALVTFRIGAMESSDKAKNTRSTLVKIVHLPELDSFRLNRSILFVAKHAVRYFCL
jgi:hypothetical protein